jgi:sacsin
MARNPCILDVLFSELIPADAELKDLDGCNLLPLADGNLATLKFADTNGTQSSKYHVVTDNELKVFEFASKYLVTASSGAKLGRVLQSGKFNLARLQLCDVRKLLDMKPTVSTPNDDEDKWLTEFWKFWNSHIDSSLPSSNIDTLNVEIFGASRDRVRIYATPVAFHTLPAVVEPSTGEHQQLCDRIPGLYRFNTKFMPKSLLDKEKSFSSEDSFYRLIRAVRILSSQTGVGAFVKTHLDLANLKVYHQLLISFEKCTSFLLTLTQLGTSSSPHIPRFEPNIES